MPLRDCYAQFEDLRLQMTATYHAKPALRSWRKTGMHMVTSCLAARTALVDLDQISVLGSESSGALCMVSTETVLVDL